ncbi:MAG: CoA transferase [Hyphomicrobiales bacterium]|nr:MAG: CoA transferase [Hyphomicrobiales bacterium]
MESKQGQGPLQGLKVLDLSTVFAGPLCAALLADFGADVIKVEMPKIGDPLRALPPHKDGISLWSKVTNRNKRTITLDLRHARAREVLAPIIARQDVVIENFRPGTLDGWGLTGGWMRSLNPRLTLVRITGFGQTGPYRDRPGFARAFEALSGFTHLCGEEDGPPLHLGFPVSDAVGGLFAALGALAALYELARNPDRHGQDIDCSMAEAMLRCMDFVVIQQDQLGVSPKRSGNTNAYAAPGSIFETRDGQWVSVPGSSQNVFERLTEAIGRPDLKTDPRFRSNPDRVRHRHEINGIVADALGALTYAELELRLDAHGIAFAPVNDAKAVMEDRQFVAREAIVEVPDRELGRVRMQNVVPRFSRTPGAVQSAGESLGFHTREVLGKFGFSSEAIASLQQEGVI